MDEERFTVFFEDPFWVGVFERVEDGRLSVCKVMFGAQPKDTEIYAFICGQYRHLTFSTAVDADDRTVPVSPKRLKKKAKRDMERQGIGTKAQQALQAQRDTQKAVGREHSKAKKAAEEARQFAIRQQKRKEKHRGH